MAHQKLIRAIVVNDIDAAMRIIESEPIDINYDNDILLGVALRCDNLHRQNIVMLLLDNGANPFARDDMLGAAVVNNYHTVIMRILNMSKGMKYCHGSKPLQEASRVNNKIVAQMLIDAGADIDGANDSHFEDMFESDVDTRTPLFIATQHHHIKLMKILIENGADVNINDGIILKNVLEYVYAFPWDNQMNEKKVRILLDAGANTEFEGIIAMIQRLEESNRFPGIVDYIKNYSCQLTKAAR